MSNKIGDCKCGPHKKNVILHHVNDVYMCVECVSKQEKVDEQVVTESKGSDILMD